MARQSARHHRPAAQHALPRQQAPATAPSWSNSSEPPCHLESSLLVGFGLRYKGLPRRFKTTLIAIDSSTIALLANCMSWAKHRRRMATAKLRLRLNLQTFLPSCAIIEEASHHDDTRSPALCAHLQNGAIALFDKAYIHLQHLCALHRRIIMWVTHAKDNMSYIVRKKLQPMPAEKILRDDLILLKGAKSHGQEPETFRRVEMLVEVIFKQLKQSLQICEYHGYSKEAIRWQL